MITTAVSGLSFLTSLRKAKPSMVGILRSATTSQSSSSSRFRAGKALSKASTS